VELPVPDHKVASPGEEAVAVEEVVAMEVAEELVASLPKFLSYFCIFFLHLLVLIHTRKEIQVLEQLRLQNTLPILASPKRNGGKPRHC
jgi:hypothetical protein